MKKKMLPSDYIKRGWCQNAHAKNKKDTPVSIASTHACKWCVSGAIQVAVRRGHIVYQEANDLRRCLESMILGQFLTKWNDSEKRKKTEVFQAMRKAEKLAGLRR